MSHLILVTGGSRSGKSSFAERLDSHSQLPVNYIATAQVYDDEMALRVKKHREQRPSDWSLIEEPMDILSVFQNLRNEQGVILLDCITLWLSNLLLNALPHDLENTHLDSEAIEKNILDLVQQMANLACDIAPQVILVTNEVGNGIVPDNPISRIYRDLAGRSNQILGRAAEKVYYVVSGYPMEIKGSGQAILDSLNAKRND